MTGNYQTTKGQRASEVILTLEPKNRLHVAHIMAVYDLCKNGMSYSNQDGDVLSAAIASKSEWVVPMHAKRWVDFHCNRRAELEAALSWAMQQEAQRAA